MSSVEAAIEADRLRRRPILMTAFAFILGVVPLVLATGPGSEMQQALGTAVFFGMPLVTLLGLIFYTCLLRRDPQTVSSPQKRTGARHRKLRTSDIADRNTAPCPCLTMNC
nr:efflux RND transporter permease subunit [uncultured Tateyamaria sp.]